MAAPRLGTIKGMPLARASAATMQNVSASQPWTKASALARSRASSCRSVSGALARALRGVAVAFVWRADPARVARTARQTFELGPPGPVTDQKQPDMRVQAAGR